MTYKVENPTKGAFNQVKDKVDRHETLINILIIVLFIGFAGVFVSVAVLVVDAVNNRQAAFIDLANKVNAQNTNNDAILHEIKEFQSLKNHDFTCTYQKGGLICQP